ncbi:hypothetical protein AVEN_153413-1 [Araneus ventricosus]|uniref:Uncharacterized protein n=1 Tax=Araneus ventricosus TaxID=182803 RepID=A0A4Y2E8K2_ARAVE|nr:hypothetical protein AVEN_153413-1 [Araneus ventricosus]
MFTSLILRPGEKANPCKDTDDKTTRTHPFRPSPLSARRKKGDALHKMRFNMTSLINYQERCCQRCTTHDKDLLLWEKGSDRHGGCGDGCLMHLRWVVLSLRWALF